MSETDQTAEKAAASNQSPPRSLHRIEQSWLLPALVDDEDRVKKLLISSISGEEDNAGDTFAERAEWYYQRRPQLLALVKDLYNSYNTLLDRCGQSKRAHKHHFRRISSSEITTVSDVDYQNEEDQENGETDISQIESDLESTISFQQQTTMAAATAVAPQNCTNVDAIVAELVTKNVENDMLLSQVNEMDQLCNESSRKIELLKNLLDLLESERIILIDENVKLGYQVNSLMVENKGLVSDAMFLKRKAAELARCVLTMREDHRVCILSQKIEDLQEQIYGLEKRNKECYQMLVKREQEAREHQKSCSGSMEKQKQKQKEMDLESYLHLEKIKLRKKTSKKTKGGLNWWERVFNCGLHPSCV